MKCGAKVLMLSSVLAVTSATAVTDGSNPYERIVERNIFGLKPPPAPPDPETLKTPPPKIVLQGISTIQGERKVLFKVAATKPGEKEMSYVMKEGQRKGEIEVLAINDKDRSIRFNNHGTIQTLNMKDDAANAPTASVAAARGAIPRPGGVALPSPRGVVPPPPSAAGGGGIRQIPSRNVRTTPQPRGLGSSSATPQQVAPPPLSREEQEILIEVNKMKAQQEGDDSAMIFPPTDLGAIIQQETGGGAPTPGNPGEVNISLPK